MAIEYEDFEINFLIAGDVVSVRVECPAGEGKSGFRLDGATEPEAMGVLRQISGWWRSGSPLRHLRAELPSLTPRDVGAQLFRLVFRGRILSLFDQSLGIAHGRDQGLRVVLRFDLKEEISRRLAQLPWELLYREDSGKFLALNTRTPIVRRLFADRPALLPSLRQAPHVLLAIAGPKDLGLIDSDKERRKIEAALDDLGAGLEVVSGATREALVTGLVRYRSQVLHFVGHGDFEGGEGVLYFEGPDGRSEPVSGARIAASLVNATALRFVFLNACATAVTSSADGHNPFAGVASALVDQGVPAVLAMQAAIPDKAAIAFSRRVYEGLALGDTIEEAVSHGRAELFHSDPDSALCAIPVLFTRLRERVIPSSLLTWIWTFLGLATASLSFNTWSQTQHWMLEVPGLRFTPPGEHAGDRAIAIFGMFWGIPLLFLLLQVTRLYPQSARSGGLEDRLPVAFNISPARLGSTRHLYQWFFFAFFLLLPMAAQIHFFDRMREGETCYDTVKKEAISIWKRVPVQQLRDKSWNRFKFDKTTFYPGVEPWFFLILELVLLAFFLSVCWRLLTDLLPARRQR
jgi:hypothetical protein